jgi:mycothiol synthase
VTSGVEVTVDRTVDAGAVLALVDAAGTADGVSALSEPFLLRLRHGGGVHVTAADGPTLVGYAQLHGGEAELVVHPAWRRRGIGRAVLAAVLGEAGSGGLRMWAHGDHPSATALGHPAGLLRYRVLWQFRRDLAGELAAPALPDGVRLRAFVPGRDEDAWLRVNARAFADHPDQGRWTREDLALRQAEPWFDPAGFLLAVDPADRILGFHWTKTHSDTLGEVYVLGIDPGAQGGGLGAALTAAGLRHLASRGLRQVMLYVDEDNPRAVALYRKLGFVQWVTDAAFRR